MIICLLIAIVFSLLGGRWLYRHYIDLRHSNAFYKNAIICEKFIRKEKNLTVELMKKLAADFSAEGLRLEVLEERDNPKISDRNDSGQRTFAIVDSFLGYDSPSCAVTFQQGKVVEIRQSGPD